MNINDWKGTNEEIAVKIAIYIRATSYAPWVPIMEALDAKDTYHEKVVAELKATITKLREALEDIIKEVEDMAPVFAEYEMDETALACLFEAEIAKEALKSTSEGENNERN